MMNIYFAFNIYVHPYVSAKVFSDQICRFMQQIYTHIYIYIIYPWAIFSISPTSSEILTFTWFLQRSKLAFD